MSINYENKKELVDDADISPDNEIEIGKSEPVSCRQKTSAFFRNFKDISLLIILLGSSVYNFSILNIPYTLCGVIFMFLLLNHSESYSKKKLIILIFVLVYSLLTFSFKILIYTFDKYKIAKVHELVTDYQHLFLNLGLKYLEHDELIDTVHTFLSDGLIIFGVIFSLIIRCIYNKDTIKDNESVLNKASVNQSYYIKISNLFLFFISLITLGIICANISLISIFYSVCIHLGLFLWTINKNRTYHKLLYYILCFLFIIHIFLTHVFNIYDLRKKYMVGSSPIKIIKWLGIIKTAPEVEYFLDLILTILGTCICIIAIKVRNGFTINKAKSFNELDDNNNNDDEKGFWFKCKEIGVKYIYSPYFVLHICRLAVIYWAWRFVSFPTFGLLIWLLYSFLIVKAEKVKYITYLLAWPSLIYSYNAFMVANIKGLVDQYIDDTNRDIFKQYAVEKFNMPLLEFIPVQLTVLMFAFLMRLNNNFDSRKINFEKSELEIEIENGQNNLNGDLKENLLVGIETQNNMKNITKINSISFSDLITKLIITNIDKITLIFMYFIAIQIVNISHLILTAIFLTQLILPQTIRKICLILIITISVIFAFEYLLDIVKFHITINDDFNSLLNLIIEFDVKKNSTEFFLPFIIYCFYIQYQNYNSSIFKSYNTDKISLKAYIEQLLINYKNLKSIILFAFILFQEIFIWIILVLLFCCICAFDTYIFFSIKLFMFFIVMYKFLNMSKTFDKAKEIIKYVWILIAYCGINTMLIYFYQFALLKYFSAWYNNFIKTLPDLLRYNMKVFGLENYTDNMAVNFLPHYGSNFLSVLLLWELRRILLIRSELNETREREKSNSSKIKSDDKNNDVTPVSLFKYYSFKVLVFLCKSYWLLIFLSICAFITAYQLSLAMILYIIIFSISFIFMFNSIVTSINKYLSTNNLFFVSRLVRFTIIEKPRNIQILKKNRKKTFKYLLISGMTYIFFTYIYTLVDALHRDYPVFTELTKNYIDSLAYLFGVFHDFSSKSNFVSCIWGHVLMICLISLDIYIQKLQSLLNQNLEVMQKIIRRNEEIEQEKTIEKKVRKMTEDEKRSESFKSAQSRKSSNNKNNKNNKNNNKEEEEIIGKKIENLNIDATKEDEFNKENNKLLETNLKENNDTEIKNREKNNSNYLKNIYALSFDIKQIPLLNDFLKIFQNYEENSKNEKYFQIHSTTNKRLKLNFTITLKKISEELITFFILLSAIIKLNIISLFYILVVLYLQFRGKNISRIFNLSILISFCITVQTIIYLSNLSIHTDPLPNLPMLALISKTLGIPWSTSVVSDSWSFFLDLGQNDYQIKTLWMEFIVIFLCFIYLDNFSYSIYEGDSTISNKDKINYYIFREKKSVKKSLKNIRNDEYEELKVNMKKNFDFELLPLNELKSIILISENENKDINAENDEKRSIYCQVIKKQRNKKRKCLVVFNWAKKTLYLTMHNLMLITTVILSMINTGLISTFYISFSLFYLYYGNNIVLAKPYSFPKVIDKFLRIFFICDLFLQLSYQNPYNVKLKDYDYILTFIGLNKIIDYSEKPDSANFFNIKSSILAIFKALTYFFVSLQVMIYSSPDFKEFYIGFILKKKDEIFRNSIINAFLFNNKRIQMMEETMDKRQQIEKVLKELEVQLDKWDKKLNNKENKKEDNDDNIINKKDSDDINKKDDLNLKDAVQEINNEQEQQKEKRNNLKEKIMDNFLIKFVIKLNQLSTNYSFIEKENKKLFENSILRGETYVKSTLELKIEKCIEQMELKQLNTDSLGVNTEIISENMTQNNYLSKHLSKWFIIRLSFINIAKFLIDNFHYICFFVMFLNNYLNANLISLVWPVTVFTVGLVEYPRPGTNFWRVCRIYASNVLGFKLIIQIYYIRILIVSMTFFTKFYDFIGIKTFEYTFNFDFVLYVIYDAVLIIFLMMQEYILISRGLWEKIEPEIETVEEAYNRIYKSRAVAQNEENLSEATHYFEDVLNDNKQKKGSFNIQLNKERTFYQRHFPKIRNNKPGRDFYAFYTVIEIILIAYLIFFFTDMDQDNMFKISGTSKVRQFSGMMVLIVFFHAIKAVLDRIIYLQQNRINLDFEYVYYDKITGEKIIPETIENFDKDNYNSIYYQKETTNYPLIFKYILQVVITILSHIFIFLFLPIMGNLNLQNSINCEVSSNCNYFSRNFYIEFFYLIYSLYLLFSAMQIHFGLLDMKDKSLLKRGDNIIYSSLFKAYNAIPFLYELKLTIDWTCTPTCLDLFKWLKFESVYDLLFMTHCNKIKEMEVPIGKNIGIFQKVLMGGSGFFVLLAILLGPLLLFSTLNPTNMVNNVTGAVVELSICFQYGERVFNNFTLFRNEFVESIGDMNGEIWKEYAYNNSSMTKNFPLSQVQIIKMSNTSDTIWDIAGPHINTIKDRLENYKNNSYNIFIGFKYSFERPSPAEAKDSNKKFDYPLYIPGKVDHEENIKILLNNMKNCEQKELLLEGFYNPALRLTSQPHPKVIWDNNVFKNVTIALNFMCDNNDGTIDYTKSYYTLKKYDERNPDSKLIFHTFSDKVSATSAAYDVITFYVSFIIVIGRIIRGVISGEAEKIIFTEMPEPNNLINLCEGIKISRYRYEFDREEYLYYILIDLMRSPEMLKLLTKSSIKKLQERKELHNNRSIANN